MPSGSKIYMNEKSAYINSGLFFRWLGKHFLPRKPEGNVLLVVDSHSSHCYVEMLEFPRQNHIAMISFPSHTTHWLQLLDSAVFKVSVFCCNKQLDSNKSNAFKATGIHLYNPAAIAEYAFLCEPNAPIFNEEAPSIPYNLYISLNVVEGGPC